MREKRREDDGMIGGCCAASGQGGIQMADATSSHALFWLLSLVHVLGLPFWVVLLAFRLPHFPCLRSRLCG